jgi:hypothetical protein
VASVRASDAWRCAPTLGRQHRDHGLAHPVVEGLELVLEARTRAARQPLVAQRHQRIGVDGGEPGGLGRDAERQGPSREGARLQQRARRFVHGGHTLTQQRIEPHWARVTEASRGAPQLLQEEGVALRLAHHPGHTRGVQRRRDGRDQLGGGRVVQPPELHQDGRRVSASDVVHGAQRRAAAAVLRARSHHQQERRARRQQLPQQAHPAFVAPLEVVGVDHHGLRLGEVADQLRQRLHRSRP